MAKRTFLVDLNLGGNKIINVVLEGLTEDPTASLKTGRLYYHTTSKVVKFYDGTAWRTLATTATVDTISANLVALATRVTAAENSITEIEEDITAALNQINENTQDINGFQEEIATKINSIDVVYDGVTKHLGLKYNNVIFSTLDVSSFIKDGMLSSAEMVEDPDGYDSGHYLKLVFNTDADQDPILINVTDLVNIYTAGNGLDKNGNTFSLKLASTTQTTANLEVTSSGLALKTGEGSIFYKLSQLVGNLSTSSPKIAYMTSNISPIELSCVDTQDVLGIISVKNVTTGEEVECEIENGDESVLISWNGTNNIRVAYLYLDI